MSRSAADPERLCLDGLQPPQLSIGGRAESYCPVLQDRSNEGSEEHQEGFLARTPPVARHRSQESASLPAFCNHVLDVRYPRKSTIKHNTQEFYSGSYLKLLVSHLQFHVGCSFPAMAEDHCSRLRS